MTFEEWWPNPKVPMPMWFASLRAGFTACWIQATDKATRAERERCAQEAYDAIVTLSSKELAEDVAAFIRKQETT